MSRGLTSIAGPISGASTDVVVATKDVNAWMPSVTTSAIVASLARRLRMPVRKRVEPRRQRAATMVRVSVTMASTAMSCAADGTRATSCRSNAPAMRGTAAGKDGSRRS